MHVSLWFDITFIVTFSITNKIYLAVIPIITSILITYFLKIGMIDLNTIKLFHKKYR